MKHKISIVLFEEYKDINFYSIVIDNNSSCEMEIFLKKLQNDSKKDAIQIANLLTKIAENGAQERYFRYEGKRKDHVYALPEHFMIIKYRLYCLRYSNALLVLGNGGLKTTKTYQQDPHLNKCVTILQKIDEEINKMIKSKHTKINGKTISGKLDFFIEY